MSALVAIVAGTFVSEDLTCITVGLLLGRGELAPAVGLLGCYLGIVLGDLGLWALGRSLGATVLRWRPVRRHLRTQHLDALADWFNRCGWQAVAFARFLPGSRFPVYVAAGAVGGRARNFLMWAALAAALWTPLLVGLVALAGDGVVPVLTDGLGSVWAAFVLTALMLFGAYRLVIRLSTREGRARATAGIARIWRWEFWPPWLFYLPVLPWIGYLAVRYRRLTLPTAANPAIPHGGFVGESKYDILHRLPEQWTARTARIDPDRHDLRVHRLRALLTSPGWAFPLIFKPDVGERGAGVRLIQGIDQAVHYVERITDVILVQEYHPGPFEAGIFYYRMPDEPMGRIFSITEKQFPVLTGDGASTVETLIRKHPRFRMQAAKFLARLNGQRNRTLAPGETLRLAVAGNHCQGTLFRDGAHLLTPQLEQTVDHIAKSYPGFFVGRFDVRYRDADAFRAGRDLTVIELNGATSESTNIYDPSWSLWRAYQTLFKQWRIVFEIGHRNRRHRHQVTPARVLASVLLAHYRDRDIPALSD